MTTVNTVNGVLDTGRLGMTLTHEHLLANRLSLSGDYNLQMTDESLAIVEAEQFRRFGGESVVDLTVDGFGRNPESLRDISLATGLNVIMGSGWYRDEYYDESIDMASVDELCESLTQEFELGVRETGIKPGIIGEIGSGEYTGRITAREERVLRAVARARNRIGCPISTHAFQSRVGLDQLDLLREEGAPRESVVIGHADSVRDPDYHALLFESGAWVQFDLLRSRFPWDISRQVELIYAVFRNGNQDRLLLSQDVCAKSHLKAYGGYGYVGIFEIYLPELEKRGIPESDIMAVLRQNPARLFEAADK